MKQDTAKLGATDHIRYAYSIDFFTIISDTVLSSTAGNGKLTVAPIIIALIRKKLPTVAFMLLILAKLG